MVECVKYDASIGELVWLTRPRSHFPTQSGWRKFNARFAGKVVGNISTRTGGYVSRDFSIEMNGARSRHVVARVIWELHNGPIPYGLEIDHKDLNSKNNRIENLRLATKSQNQCNTALRADNSTGFKGVTRHGERFKANIRARGKQVHLGVFDTPEDAHAAYSKAAVQTFGEYARTH